MSNSGNDKADGLNRASSIETNPYKQSNSGAPWSKKNDGSKSTTGGPTSGGKIKR